MRTILFALPDVYEKPEWNVLSLSQESSDFLKSDRVGERNGVRPPRYQRRPLATVETSEVSIGSPKPIAPAATAATDLQCGDRRAIRRPDCDRGFGASPDDQVARESVLGSRLRKTSGAEFGARSVPRLTSTVPSRRTFAAGVKIDVNLSAARMEPQGRGLRSAAARDRMNCSQPAIELECSDEPAFACPD